MRPTMLIVEDDGGLRPALERSFTRKGYDVAGVGTVAAAVERLGRGNLDLLLADHHLPDGSGLEVLREARELDPDTVVVMMTAFPEVRTAVTALKGGASDFVIKPFELEELHLAVARAMEVRTLRRDVQILERERDQREGTQEILGESPAIAQVRELIRKVAGTDAPVLITGETGTGKELVANAIHRLSPRASRPMVTVNCSTFSEHLLESELFGHEKGAFTDAKEARAGLFEMANGGTLFLDEVAEMKTGLQAKLLRVVEGEPFRRLGGRRDIQASVRVIAATNRDLPASIRAGHFREDLFFRLNIFPIVLPPLRARERDILLIAPTFLQRYAAKLRRPELRFSAAAEAALLAHAWPGNLRELRNMVERAAILCEGGEVLLAHLPGEIQVTSRAPEPGGATAGALAPLSRIEAEYIARVVQAMDGNLSRAAQVLGISRNTLKAKLG